MTVADQHRMPLGLVATGNLLEAIARSSDVSWLTTCLNHNVRVGNTAVVQATQQRLAALARSRSIDVGTGTHMSATEQALAIWPLLTKRASGSTSVEQATITYGNLAVAIVYPNTSAARSIRRALGLIGWYCLKRGMPALNSLVVNKSSGDAGESVVLHNGLTQEEERVNVVEFDWLAAVEPTAATLLQTAAEHSRRTSLKG
jgi:hypothetical protein